MIIIFLKTKSKYTQLFKIEKFELIYMLLICTFIFSTILQLVHGFLSITTDGYDTFCITAAGIDTYTPKLIYRDLNCIKSNGTMTFDYYGSISIKPQIDKNGNNKILNVKYMITFYNIKKMNFKNKLY